MSISKIEKLLLHCELRELKEIQEIVSERIATLATSDAHKQDSEGHNNRQEERFKTNLLGTLTRITDVRPGERKEYSITINDISRSGMRLKVDSNFIPSRVVEVTFAAPGGKIKRCFMEVVRMRKDHNEDGSWLDVGCRVINNEEVRCLRLREEQIAKTRNKLRKRTGILILLIGKDADIEKKRLLTTLKAKNYNVKRVDSVRKAMESAGKVSAQLAIFCNGSQLCKDEKLLSEVKNKPANMATLALIEKDSDRLTLLKAGIDECLTLDKVNEFISHAIERAMVGHAMRGKHMQQQLSGRALIYTIDNSRVNMVGYQLEENGYSYRVATNTQEAQRFAKDPFDMVIADFDITDYSEFIELREIFAGLPVIAMCDELAHGQEAMVNGATNYLSMPPSREDILLILEMAAEQLSVSS